MDKIEPFYADELLAALVLLHDAGGTLVENMEVTANLMDINWIIVIYGNY